MPLDYSHPKVIRFLQESYNKENEDRISWFIKNKEKIIKAATLGENHKGYRTEDVARTLVEPLMSVLSLHHKVTKVNCLAKPQVGITVPRTRKSKLICDIPDSKMKPVNPDDKKILFEEIPMGRQQYLNVRNKIAPEERYNHCETSNGVYGWKLSDYENIYQPGKHRLYDSVIRDTVSRSGPQADPKHYGKVLQQYSKCNKN